MKVDIEVLQALQPAAMAAIERAEAAEAEIERLRCALAPFAHFAMVRMALGGNAPKSGPVYSVSTREGEADITAEDFALARKVFSEGLT